MLHVAARDAPPESSQILYIDYRSSESIGLLLLHLAPPCCSYDLSFPYNNHINPRGIDLSTLAPTAQISEMTSDSLDEKPTFEEQNKPLGVTAELDDIIRDADTGEINELAVVAEGEERTTWFVWILVMC